MAYDLKEITKTFFEDPRWAGVEEMLLEHITPLLDMKTLDIKQPAEAVKAEVIGRLLAYDRLYSFMRQAKIVGSSPPPTTNNPFR